MNTTVRKRREAMIDFIDYALAKPDVRIISMKEPIQWLQNPIALREDIG